MLVKPIVEEPGFVGRLIRNVPEGAALFPWWDASEANRLIRGCAREQRWNPSLHFSVTSVRRGAEVSNWLPRAFRQMWSWIRGGWVMGSAMPNLYARAAANTTARE